MITLHVLCVQADHEAGEHYLGYGQVLNWRVSLAGGIEAALAECTRQPFDVLVVDEDLGDASGFDLLARIKSEAGPNAKTPHILCVSAFREDDLRRSFAIGIGALETKPLLFSTFRMRVLQLAVELRDFGMKTEPEHHSGGKIRGE